MTNRFRKPLIILAIALVVLAAVLVIINRQGSDRSSQIEVEVAKGEFESLVYSTGQLQASQSVSINVPAELSSRQVRIYEIKVTSIVDEGTVVDSGEFVASLDHSAIAELLVKAREDLQKAADALDDAKLDTSMNLSNLRDELLNARVTVETKKLVAEQSIYESPAVKRQATLDLERANRDLEQQIRNYDLKKKQDEYKVMRAREDMRRESEKVEDINKLFGALEIKAPQAGMVIYSLDRFGKKIKAGSTVSRWSPQITELPDLSSMISKTYINEIDISKVKRGQSVEVGIDAFPEKRFQGVVTSVANIGQTLPSGDSKVFEVIVKINGSDPDLRPAMTTMNVIKTATLKDVLYVPQDAIFSNDSANFVYRIGKNERTRQIIEKGDENENYVVILQGLEQGDRVLLTVPSDFNSWPIRGEEIYRHISELKEKELEQMKHPAKDSLSHRDRRPPMGERGERGQRGGERMPRNPNAR
jgi:multidrug efflux pump subunit AcrA (membrane-fusion protein)